MMSQINAPWVEQLASVISPPAEPRFAEGDSSVVTSVLGVNLPSDYWALLRAFGVGEFDSFVVLLSPFAPGEFHNLVEAIRDLKDAAEHVGIDGQPGFPFELYHSAQGVVPFAWTANDEWLLWKAKDDIPDNWTTMIYSNRMGTNEEFPAGASELLFKLLSKQLVCGIFPEDFPSKKLVFRPQ